jgi:hypothetical protein
LVAETKIVEKERKMGETKKGEIVFCLKPFLLGGLALPLLLREWHGRK